MASQRKQIQKQLNKFQHELNDYQRKVRRQEKEARGEISSPEPSTKMHSSQASLEDTKQSKKHVKISQDQEKRCLSLPNIEQNEFSSLDGKSHGEINFNIPVEEVNLGEVVLANGEVEGSIRREDSKYLDDYIGQSEYRLNSPDRIEPFLAETIPEQVNNKKKQITDFRKRNGPSSINTDNFNSVFFKRGGLSKAELGLGRNNSVMTNK